MELLSSFDPEKNEREMKLNYHIHEEKYLCFHRNYFVYEKCKQFYQRICFFHCRNCLIGQGYAVKISDFAMFRPAYSSDYFKTTENVKDITTANATNQEDVIPLRWIPWEVYIMVRVNCFLLT